MSRETKAALDAAIQAHISDVGEGIVTGYVMQVAYFNADIDGRDATGYYVEVADNQPFHVGRGLASLLDYHYENLFYGDDDDDD